MRRLIPATVVLVVALLALATVAFAQETPSVTVNDQRVTDNSVVVASVVYTAAGWMVIHKDANGQPGPVIGQTAVEEGTNADVQVELTEDVEEGQQLWAMLHDDAGTVGTYEFPGPDVPVQVEGQIVVEPFTVTGVGEEAAAAQVTPTATAVMTPAAEVTPTATVTPGAPTTLPTTGGDGGGGFSLPLALALLGLGVLLVVGALALRPRLR